MADGNTTYNNTALNAPERMLLRGLGRLVVRYAICDLNQQTYTFYNPTDEPNVPLGSYESFVEGMTAQLHITGHIDELQNATSPENIRAELAEADGLYRYDYVGNVGADDVFYRLSVMPLEFHEGSLCTYLVLVMDVTDTHRREMRTEQALKDACAAANNANEAKTRFLSSMSHDIRTPMNAIIGMTAIASAHINEPERVKDSLSKITTSSRHLLGLINEVLDMNRIERGTVSLEEEEFSLTDLIDNMIEMVRPQIESRLHDFDVHVHNIMHEDVIGDSLRVQQVFTNVMGNAIKYTPIGGNIKLTVSEKPTQHTGLGCFEFVIEDNGIGMDEDYVRHVFEPFTRAENAEKSSVQGSGLGLAITKNIVSMMNGDISIASKLGEGTTVTVRIFLKLQDADDSDIAELANLPVLVVDDDTDCCESTVATLESIGMQGEWVDNGKDAVARVKTHHETADDYYAIILDWQMPEMDGLETARFIRQIVGPEITIILLTAFDFVEIEDEARAAGIDYFVLKPLFRSRLKKVFKHVSGEVGAAKEYDNATESFDITNTEDNYEGKRFLVVEDNLLNQEIMVELIAETGGTVDVAENGKVAVDKVNGAPKGYYSMVFMDIQMPVMNGYEATMAIRALPSGKGRDLPIIALTANAFAEDVVMAKSAGINEHVAKPIDFKRLNEVIRTWVK